MRTPIKKDGPDKQTEPEKKKAGGPPKEIDMALLKQLALMQCTDIEIAATLGVSHDTLNRRKQSDPAFLEILEYGKAHGRASLRRKQYAVALNGNVPMMIWLGKQYLGQRDKFEDERSNETDIKFVAEIPPEEPLGDWLKNYGQTGPDREFDA